VRRNPNPQLFGRDLVHIPENFLLDAANLAL
jgi:hypothetical protein